MEMKYNGVMMSYNEYIDIQKRLWDEMTSMKANNEPVEMATMKQRYGTNKLSVESAKYLYLQMSEHFLKKMFEN